MIVSQSKRHNKSFFTRLHGLFFSLSHIYKLPTEYTAFVWIIEKLSLISLLLLLMFTKTPWDPLNSALINFNVLSYFSASSSGFSIFCYILFGVFHVFFLVLIYRLVSQKLNHPVADWFLAWGFHFVFVIGTQLFVMAALYLFVSLGDGTKFAAYKMISAELVNFKSSTHIILSVLMGIVLIEVIVVNMSYLVLIQDERLTIWCCKSWEFKLLGFLTKLGLICGFVLDSNDNYLIITGLCVMLLFLCRIVLRFWTPLGYKYKADLVELGYDISVFLLEAIIVVCNVSEEYTLADYYQYAMLTPIYAVIFCFIRAYITSPITELNIKTESDALDYLRELLRLCHDKSNASFVSLLGLLACHRKNCTKPICACTTIFSEGYALDAHKTTIQLNLKAYETINVLPEKITKSWKLKALNLLAAEVNPQLSRSYNLALALAEISFYYSANYYQALCYVESIESHRQSLICAQYTTNIRQVFEKGMWDKQEEAAGLLTSLEFQEKYDEFLGCIEDTCESTINFWTTLLGDKPQVEALMKGGKDLYEKRIQFLQLAQEISKINPNHLEFLVKFGLYTKLILHDKFSASHAFQKILWTAENLNTGLIGHDSRVSLFREDCQTMLVVVSLEQSNFFLITAGNNELEYQLGYKREELIRFSANKLMPSNIAKQHYQFVQKFFQTMETKNIGLERLKFIRHQEGHLLPCKVSKHIVPTIRNGLQGVMLFYEDSSIFLYTQHKTDRTKRRTGAFICDTKERILDVTKEAYTYLGFTKESMQTVKSSITISTIFPEMREEPIMERMSRIQGTVISYSPEYCEIEEFHEDHKMDAAQRHKKILLWVRIVYETYGDEEVLILLFSPIIDRFIPEYTRKFFSQVPIIASIQYNNHIFEHTNIIVRESKKLMKVAKQSEAESKPDSFAEFEFSDQMSVQSSIAASLQSSGASTGNRAQLDLFTQELQFSVASKETPSLIKKLISVLIAFFTVVVILIGLESVQFYKEIVDLKERFQMIEYFQIRYELIVYLSVSPRSYDTYRRSTVPATFVSYCKRTRIRADRAAEYNIKTRQSFEKFKLEYDYQDMTITYGGERYIASFYYALIKVFFGITSP